MVAGILLGNAGADGLRAFEAAPGVKERALLAAMQFGAATRALTGEIDSGGKQGGAGSAPHHLALAHQMGCLGAKVFGSLCGLALSALAAFAAAP